MPTRRLISLLPFTLPLLALSACTDSSEAEQDPDLDEETLEAAPTLTLPQALTVPPALTRAGVAPFGPQAVVADPPAPTPTPGPIPPRPTEGDHLLARGPGGAAWVPYHIVGDDVMIGEDVVLGTVAEVLGGGPDSDTPGARALGLADLGKRWPDGVVPYEIDIDVGIPNATIIDETLARLAETLPVRFVVDADAADRVRFVLWDKDFGLSEGIGMTGGVQQIKLPENKQPPEDELPKTVNARTIAHEMLHALGRFHEQQRPDRDNFVDYHDECVNPGSEGNFSKLVGELPLGPYDLGSLMHYRGISQCEKNLFGFCLCNTLEYKGTSEPVVSPTSGCDEAADPVCFFSDLDIGAMWTMYGDFIEDTAEYNDYLGWATAAGDFDGDGLDDIASSALLTDGWRGKVMTFKGSYGIKDGMWAITDPGIVPWRVLRRTAFEPAMGSDLFGMSLVAADFDDDGFDDLAVGTPGAGGHGAVYLYRGSRAGLVADVELTASTDGGNLPFAGADYGSALAAADLNGDGVPELVVGAPGDRAIVGQNPCGGVYAYKLTNAPDLLARWSPTGAACHANAEAGASLAASSRSGAAGKLIVVGAPGADSDRGRVWVLGYANAATLSITANLTQGSPQSCGVGGVVTNPREVGDRFGAAVAAGPRADTHHMIAVGSPGEDSSSGQVDTFRYDTSCWARENPLTEAPMGVDEPGDQFGATLAIGNLTDDAYGDLLVGAPGEAVGNITAGWMYTFRGSHSGFVPHHGFGQSSGGWNNGNGERFGQSFVLAEVDGNVIDLVVGAPGNHINGASYAGSLFLWQGQGNNKPTGWRSLTVDSKSPYAD